MSKSLPERRPLFLLVLILSSLLILMSHQIRTGAGGTLLENSLLSVSGPVVKGTTRGLGLFTGLWSGYLDLRGARRENELLRAKLEESAEKAREGEEFRRENLRLRNLLDLKSGQTVPTVAAEVLTVSAAGQARTALIGRGASDGVRKDMAVINRQGVVGRVIAVGGGVAKVQLLIDPNNGVAGLLQRSRGQGMVLGIGDRGCRMEYVSELEDVQVGDSVVTSGLDRIYPKGISIGIVSAVEEGDQLTKSITIRPEVDFRRLEEVLVVLAPTVSPSDPEAGR